MIRHMLFWNLKDPAADRAEVREFLQKSFREMVEQIPELLAAQVDFDAGAGTHDIGLYCEFKSMEDMRAYQQHPRHLAFKEAGAKWLTGRVCVDLEVEA